MVSFGGDGVEVIDYLGGGRSTEPIDWQANIVNASQSGASVLFGDASEGVSVTGVGLKGGRKKNVSFTQKADKV